MDRWKLTKQSYTNLARAASSNSGQPYFLLVHGHKPLVVIPLEEWETLQQNKKAPVHKK